MGEGLDLTWLASANDTNPSGTGRDNGGEEAGEVVGDYR